MPANPLTKEQGGCYDCGAPYGEDGWCDVIIPNEIWNSLKVADGAGAGLLCFRCMTKRLLAAGYSHTNTVPVIIASGPYRDANEEWRLIGCRHGYEVAREEQRELVERLQKVVDAAVAWQAEPTHQMNLLALLNAVLEYQLWEFVRLAEAAG